MLRSPLTVSGRLVVPDRPELYGEERRPTEDVGKYDDHGHLHRLYPRLGHPRHAAGSGGQRFTNHLSDMLRLHVKVEVHRAADAHLTRDHRKNRQDEYNQSRPGHVGSRSPRHDELRPAVMYSGSDLDPREDENLRKAADQRDAPRGAHWTVPARPAPLECHHGFADGLVSVYRHRYYHVRGGKHPDNLQVLHQATQYVWADESVGDVPHELRTNLKECHHQIGDAQMEHENSHPGQLLPALPQHQQNTEV